MEIDRIQAIKEFIREMGLWQKQTFNSHDWALGNPVSLIYNDNDVEIYFCYDYNYLEIIGLTEEEFKHLRDVLNICCL